MSSNSGFKLFGKKPQSNSIFRKNISTNEKKKDKVEKKNNNIKTPKQTKFRKLNGKDWGINNQKKDPVKFRKMNSDEWGLNKDKSCVKTGEPTKFRTLFDVVSENKENKPTCKTEYIDTKKNNASLNSNKKEEVKINDSWELTEDEKRITNVVIGSILYQYKDLTPIQAKIIKEASTACNKKLREDEIKRRNENSAWINNNPEKYRIGQDLHRLFLSAEVPNDLWDEVVAEYETGQYTYSEFFDLIRVEIKNDWEENSIKRLRNIKKKIKQINSLLANQKKGKKLTQVQIDKVKKLRLFKIIKGNIEYWLSDKV